MKTNHFVNNFLLAVCILCTTLAFAQAPKGINYQAVARTQTGGVMFNQTVNLQISILDGSPNGATQYSEKHSVSTNQYGLFTVMIGHGTVVSGIFDSIPWSNGNQWIKTEMDALNTGVYTQVGSVQLLSVPYSFYAEKSGSSSSAGSSGRKGVVNTDGTIASGAADFTVTNSAPGVYQITFTTPMTASPVVNIAAEDTMGSPATGAVYCTSNATSTADDEILNVTVGTLNNTSACGDLAPGAGSIAFEYSNYTSVTAPDLAVGATINSSVTIGYCNGFAYSTSFAVYIDYDQNGSFLDAGELVYTLPTTTAAVGGTAYPFTFTPPATALNGFTRMRVIDIEFSAGPAPCGTYTWGETEDYNVNITGGVTVPPVLIISKTYMSVSDLSVNGFTVHVLNSSGTPVNQKFHFIAQ